jgi:hypothetical protein
LAEFTSDAADHTLAVIGTLGSNQKYAKTGPAMRHVRSHFELEFRTEDTA